MWRERSYPGPSRFWAGKKLENCRLWDAEVIRRAILRDSSKYETVKKDFDEIVKKETAMRGTER